ncbi:MAG TPA: flagellar basal body P-ring formation chaperone FlgA [Gammaproteobacteria bacterium]|nr:flagellar basal body P-ring formation chaperone FlgA [Gammaproteobacteria bacterium]
MHIDRQIILLGLALALGAVAVEARAEIQALDDIRGAARDFLLAEAGGREAGVEVEVGRLDARLKLQRCSLPLTPFMPPGGRTSGHTSVGVRCEGDMPWTLFVPALVRRAQDLVVAARPIARGTILSAADVTTVTKLLPNAPAGMLESPEVALGRIAMRDIAAGTALNANQLKAPQIVRRGQAVTLSLASGPVAVRVAGTALKDGTLGERIPVRNANSKRVVEGVVLADGLVEVAALRP